MSTYYIEIDGGQGGDTNIEADSLDEAQSLAEDWADDGDWGEDGCEIELRVTRLDDPDETVSWRYEIEPNHTALIAALDYDDSCGDDPDDHDWTSEGEGGCSENPGCWSLGGTAFKFRAHCRRCGLIRISISTGPQRNPGDHDTVEYQIPTASELHQYWMDDGLDVPPGCSWDEDAEITPNLVGQRYIVIGDGNVEYGSIIPDGITVWDAIDAFVASYDFRLYHYADTTEAERLAERREAREQIADAYRGIKTPDNLWSCCVYDPVVADDVEPPSGE